MSGRTAWALAVSILMACARRPPDLAPALDALGADWYSFRWIDATVGDTPVSGISLLVRWPEAKGDTSDLQLDFGLAGQRHFGFPIRNLSIDSLTADPAARLHGAVAILGDRDDSTAAVGAGLRLGTLGLLAFYFGPSTLLVDPVDRRIGRVRSSDSLPRAILDRLHWTPIREVDGRLYVRLVAGGETRGEALIDPASGLVPVLLESELWREVTAADGAALEATQLAFPVAGGELVLEGAPVRRQLAIGGLTLSDPVVYHVASAPASADPFARLGPIRGLVGAQIFGRGRLAVIDLRRKRMGWYR